MQFSTNRKKIITGLFVSVILIGSVIGATLAVSPDSFDLLELPGKLKDPANFGSLTPVIPRAEIEISDARIQTLLDQDILLYDSGLDIYTLALSSVLSAYTLYGIDILNWHENLIIEGVTFRQSVTNPYYGEYSTGLVNIELSSNIQIRDCNFYSNAPIDYGIRILDSTDIIIDGCTMPEGRGMFISTGINAINVDRLTVENNYIASVQTTAYFENIDTLLITKNMFIISDQLNSKVVFNEITNGFVYHNSFQRVINEITIYNSLIRVSNADIVWYSTDEPYMGNSYSNYAYRYTVRSQNGLTYLTPYEFEVDPNNVGLIISDLYPVVSAGIIYPSGFGLNDHADITYEVSSQTAIVIAWVPYCNLSFGVNNYNVTCNDHPVYNHTNKRWYSETPILVDVSNLSVGEYTYNITVSNGEDVLTDIVIVSVYNQDELNLPPYFALIPGNLSYWDEGDRFLTWYAADPMVNNPVYNITVNGIVHSNHNNTPWESLEPINFNLGPLDPGTYYIELIVFDGLGLNVSTYSIVTKIPTAETNFPPLFVRSLPTDLQFYETDIRDFTLEWTVLDTTTLTRTYDIYKNDVKIVENAVWNNLAPIIFPLTDDNRQVEGVVTYRINVFDGLGESITHTVRVNILATVDNIKPTFEKAPPSPFVIYDTELTRDLQWKVRDVTVSSYSRFCALSVTTAGVPTQIFTERTWDHNIPIVQPLLFSRPPFNYGSSTFTFTVYDGLGKSETATTNVLFQRNYDPTFFFTPNTVSYLFDTQPVRELLWVVNDTTTRNQTFSIYKDGDIYGDYDDASWVSQAYNYINMASLAIGSYEIQAIFTDGLDRSIESTTQLHVLQNTDPILSMDRTSILINQLIYNDMPYAIDLCTVDDTTAMGQSYLLLENGAVIARGAWNAYTPIRYNWYGHPAGEFEYTLIIDDGVGGEVLTRSFSVNIRSGGSSSYNPYDPRNWDWRMVVIIVGGVGGLYVIIRRLQKGTNDLVTAYKTLNWQEFADEISLEEL